MSVNNPWVCALFWCLAISTYQSASSCQTNSYIFSVAIEKWPSVKAEEIDAQAEENFQIIQDLITAIRSWRKEKNIEPKEILKIKVASDDDLIKKEKNIIDYLAKVEVESVDKLAECDLEVAGMKVKIGVI